MLRRSIRNRLMALILFSIIVPVIASTLISIYFARGELEERVVDENTRLLYHGLKNLDHYMASLNRTTSVMYNTGIYSILTQGAASFEQSSVVHATLQSLSHTMDGIYQLHLRIDASQDAYLLTGPTFASGKTSEHAWMRQIEPYETAIEPPHMSHNYGLQIASYRTPTQVITYHRPIYQVPSTHRIGMLSIDLTLDEISSLGNQLYNHDHEKLFLLDRNGIVIYASDLSRIGETLAEEWAGIILESNEETGSLEWKDAQFSGSLVFSKLNTLSSWDWTIVKQIPDSYLYENVRNITKANVSMALILLIAAASVSLAMSLNLINPIKQLIRHINKIQIGQWNEPIKINRQDEIGIMAHRFQAMMDTINDLFVQRYQLELANKTNQLKMLQAQINPHFINNTLQSIGTLALQHGDEQIYRLIYSLGQMMHYSMDTNETVLPIGEELKYLDNYLQLQQHRFDENFRYTITAGPGAEQMAIPKMLLQPIVENYFKHGFVSQKNGLLLIKAELEGDRVRIVIEDNGAGIGEQTMKRLREELSRPPSADLDAIVGIGLTNVMARLNLYYQGRAVMEIENIEPHGVRVTLTLPANLEVPS